MTRRPSDPPDEVLAGRGAPADEGGVAGADVAVVDLSGVAFARRLGNLLTVSRQQSGLSRRALARQSGGRFTSRDLKAAEEAKRLFGPTTLGELAVLYNVDLAVILPERLPLTVWPDGVMGTAGVEIRFTPGDVDAALTAYLKLVRGLRREQHARLIDVRRDDVEVLAQALGRSPEFVLDRLGALMGSTRAQRGVMGALFAAGAAVIGLASSSAAPATRART